MNFEWKYAQTFYERVDRLGLHGLHFQHVTLCERRAWMYLHGINFAHWNSRVQLGIVKHSVSYARDHSVNGLFGLAPDRIDWGNRIVYENKGTAGAEEASNNQTAFYAAMLSIATGKEWKAFSYILSTRRYREVIMDDRRMEKLIQASEHLEQLANQRNVPPAVRIPLCHTCSIAGFCGYD